jgi:hypothetical protein
MWKRTGDGNDTGLAGDALGGPGKVTRVETQGTVLVVAAAGADDVDALGADTSVGGLATKLEGSLLPCTQQLSEMFAFLLCVEQAQNARGRFPTGLSPSSRPASSPPRRERGRNGKEKKRPPPQDPPKRTFECPPMLRGKDWRL